MISITDLMVTCAEKNITLRLNEENELVINAPKGFWEKHGELLALLKSNKTLLKEQLIIRNNYSTLKKIDSSVFHTLSYSQNRMWFHQQIHLDSASYNMPIAFKLKGKVDIDKLNQSFAFVMNHHESLRMGFESLMGEPRQFILSKQSSWDILRTEQGKTEMAAHSLIEDFIRKPFSLDNPPLLRALFVGLDKEEAILVICFHHIISDGLSINLFLESLSNYFNKGEVIEERKIHLDYCDYINWHNNWLNSESAKNELLFWKNRLARVDADTGDLLGDKPRPLAVTFDVNTTIFSIEKEVVIALKQFCNTEGTTLYAALLAAYSFLCGEYNGRCELVVGTPVSGRTRVDFDHIIGLFVNTLPLFVEYNPSQSYKAFCHQLTKAVLDDFNHQNCPFDKIVNSLNIKRDIARNPLFQTMFLVEYQENNHFLLNTLEVTRYPVDLQRGQVDLTFGASISSDKIEISIEYNTKIYSSEWIKSFKNNFNHLLKKLIQSPHAALSTISVVSDIESDELLHFGRFDKVLKKQKELNVAYLIDEIAKEQDNKISIIDRDTSYTYKELKVLSDHLARGLIQFGVQKGDIVALKMNRSKELIAFMLAIWKAGATYLPIDPKSPIKRTEYVLSDSAAKWVMTDASFYELSQQEYDPHIKLDYDSISSPAYVIYTSGTTGQPKGVIIPHKGLVNLIHFYQEVYGVTKDDRCSQFATQAFDTFGCEVWSTLAIGASLYIVDEDTKLSPLELIHFFNINKITVCDIPTALAPTIWEEISQPNSMRIMKIGGEKLSKYPPKNLSYLVVNSYGPTENTIESTYNFLNSKSSEIPEAKLHSTPSIGIPFPGVNVAVVNKQHQLVPINAPGELILLGTALADGYLNKPELTNEKFVEFSFQHGLPTLRGYKTGDIVKWCRDGKIEFIGRVDNQVKIRNFRIELSEIDFAINKIEGVVKSSVNVYGESNEEKIIVAFVVFGNSPLSVADIKDQLKAFLPDYMIPAKIFVVDTIPLTLNGKVDVSVLQAMIKENMHHTKEDYTPPKTALEASIAAIWSEVLQLKSVGIHDNFFEIGGDSLSSIRISAHARRKGIHIQPLHLHQHKTISEIIRRVKDLLVNVVADKSKKQFQEKVSKLSPIQTWFINQQYAEPAHFNQSLLFTVPDWFTNKIAEKLINWLVVQHEIITLRLAKDHKHFIVGGQFDPSSFFQEVCISSFESATDQIERITRQAQASFNLYTVPLFKLIYIHDEGGKVQRLCIVAHHLLIDAASWFILIDDINYFLANIRDGEVDYLPETNSFSEWIDKTLELESQNHDSLTGNYLYSNHELSMGNSKLSTVLLSKENHVFLQKAAKKENIKFHEMLLILCSKYISTLLSLKLVNVEIESHGRFESLVEGINLSRTLGWFTAVYPLRLDVASMESTIKSISLVNQLSEKEKFSYLRNLKNEIPPVFDLSFNFHGDVRNKQEDANHFLYSAPEKISHTISPLNHRSSIFDINAYLGDHGLQIELTYPNKLQSLVGTEDQIKLMLQTIMDGLGAKNAI